MEGDHVTIVAPTTSHNTDGFDCYGSPAYIHDCHIDVGDDNVAVHGSDLLVENSYMGHGHGLSIGSVHSNAHVSNITVRSPRLHAHLYSHLHSHLTVHTSSKISS